MLLSEENSLEDYRISFLNLLFYYNREILYRTSKNYVFFFCKNCLIACRSYTLITFTNIAIMSMYRFLRLKQQFLNFVF